MKPKTDVIFQWVGFGDGHFRGWNSWCRVRIWKSGQIIVLMSDLDEDTGTSITNSVENVMSLIRQTYELIEPITWIEHYPRHNAILLAQRSANAQLKQQVGEERANRKIKRDFMYQEGFSTVICEWNGKHYCEPKWQHFKPDNSLLKDIETDMNHCDRLPLVVAQVIVNRQVVER